MATFVVNCYKLVLPHVLSWWWSTIHDMIETRFLISFYSWKERRNTEKHKREEPFVCLFEKIQKTDVISHNWFLEVMDKVSEPQQYHHRIRRGFKAPWFQAHDNQEHQKNHQHHTSSLNHWITGPNQRRLDRRHQKTWGPKWFWDPQWRWRILQRTMEPKSSSKCKNTNKRLWRHNVHQQIPSESTASVHPKLKNLKSQI